MLLEERHRTFIVHSEPISGKSKYAKQFAKNIGGKYLDLLELFREDKKLKNNIDTFNIKELETLLIEEAKETNLLIIDNIEPADKDLTSILENVLRMRKDITSGMEIKYTAQYTEDDKVYVELYY
jgi:hypothetical protein